MRLGGSKLDTYDNRDHIHLNSSTATFVVFVRYGHGYDIKSLPPHLSCCQFFVMSEMLSRGSMTSVFVGNAQNVKAVFDAAIRVVIKPPQKQKEKKKPRKGCFV